MAELRGTSSSSRTLDERDLAALRPIRESAPRPRKQRVLREVTTGIVCFCGERFGETQALEFMLHLRAEVGEVLDWRARRQESWRRYERERWQNDPEHRERKRTRERERYLTYKERKRELERDPARRARKRERERERSKDPEYRARRAEAQRRYKERKRLRDTS